jgi:ammonium transporter Rh
MALLGLLLLPVLAMFAPPAIAADHPAESSMAEAIACESGTTINQVVDIQKYNRSIHVMAMLLVGFGFLMVFVRNYGLSAATATFLLVSTAIPLYILINSWGILGHPVEVEIDRLILAQFAAASLLICAGAVLGRLKMWQYIVMGLLFIPAYMLNEWIVVEDGIGIISGPIADTGGSIVIHAFGAFFGLGVLLTMTTKKEFDIPIESDATSDRFSMLGSMILWLFWPSFCAALVSPDMIPATIVNVVLALAGSTLATYFASVIFRKGKISSADIANAALAGGVAIGSTCDITGHTMAFVIGVLAGVLSTFGFAVIQSKFEGAIKATDTCGVMYLHGLPGLLGGVAAIFVQTGIASAQLKGIAVTVIVAVVTGFVAGKILAITGRRQIAYQDAEEFQE